MAALRGHVWRVQVESGILVLTQKKNSDGIYLVVIPVVL